MSADAAKNVLGNEKEMKTLTNCADDGGRDKAYLYQDLELVTTKDGKREVVREITLKTSAVSTEEGVKAGDLPAAVKRHIRRQRQWQAESRVYGVG